MKRLNLVSLILIGIAILGIGFFSGSIFVWERYVEPERKEAIEAEEIRLKLKHLEGQVWVLTNFAAYRDAVQYDGQVLNKLIEAITRPDTGQGG